MSVAPTLNVSLYESLIVRGVAAILLVLGLVPAKPPPFSWWSMLIALAGCGALCGIAVAAAALLPPLAHINSLEAAAAHGEAPLRWVTAWQWTLSVLMPSTSQPRSRNSAIRPLTAVSSVGQTREKSRE